MFVILLSPAPYSNEYRPKARACNVSYFACGGKSFKNRYAAATSYRSR